MWILFQWELDESILSGFISPSHSASYISYYHLSLLVLFYPYFGTVHAQASLGIIGMSLCMFFDISKAFLDKAFFFPST